MPKKGHHGKERGNQSGRHDQPLRRGETADQLSPINSIQTLALEDMTDSLSMQSRQLAIKMEEVLGVPYARALAQKDVFTTILAGFTDEYGNIPGIGGSSKERTTEALTTYGSAEGDFYTTYGMQKNILQARYPRLVAGANELVHDGQVAKAIREQLKKPLTPQMQELQEQAAEFVVNMLLRYPDTVLAPDMKWNTRTGDIIYGKNPVTEQPVLPGIGKMVVYGPGIGSFHLLRGGAMGVPNVYTLTLPQPQGEVYLVESNHFTADVLQRYAEKVGYTTTPSDGSRPLAVVRNDGIKVASTKLAQTHPGYFDLIVASAIQAAGKEAEDGIHNGHAMLREGGIYAVNAFGAGSVKPNEITAERIIQIADQTFGTTPDHKPFATNMKLVPGSGKRFLVALYRK